MKLFMYKTVCKILVYIRGTSVIQRYELYLVTYLNIHLTILLQYDY